MAVPTDPASQRTRIVAVATVVALMSTYIASSAFSAAIQDTARDVFYAYSIRHGLWYPLEGPVLGGAVHLGPVWFYVLSLPLWVHDSWLSVALFAAFLGSLKFPLAVMAGRRLLDLRFGILWACMLALPGWNSLEQLIFFNPNPAAAVVTGSWLLWMHARERPTAARAFALGFTLALALHIHPTTAPALLLGLFLVREAPRSVRVRIAGVLVAGFALPFLPYVIHEAANGFPDATTAARYVGTQVSVANALSAPWLLVAYVIGGPQALIGYLWKPGASAGLALACILVLPLAWLCWHCWPPPREETAILRRVARFLAIGLALFALWSACLRPTTPAYFTYVLAPFVAGLLALALWDLTRRPVVALCVIFASVFIAAAVGVRMASIVASGEGVLSSRILDVKQVRPTAIYADTWFPAAGHASLSRFLCRLPRGASLHGELAYIEDRSVGMDLLFGCADASRSVLVGDGKANGNAFGMSREFWRLADASPRCWSGSLGLAEPLVVASRGSGIPLPDGRRYFPRDRTTAPMGEHIVELDAPSGAAVVISNSFLGYEGLADVTARADGMSVVPVARNDLAWLFRATSASRSVHWRLSFKSTKLESVDIVAVPLDVAAGSVPDCGSTH
jgi:hypothetical protein